MKWTQHAVFLAGHILLDVCRYDHVTQIIDENHVHISVGSSSPRSACAWPPPEFDLMAGIADRRLRAMGGVTASRALPSADATSAFTSEAHERRQPALRKGSK